MNTTNNTPTVSEGVSEIDYVAPVEPPAPPAPPTLADLLDAAQAKREQGPWVPACNGTEVPFTTRTGARLLYCWQPTTGRHAYLDLGTDMILSDDDAMRALAVY